MSYRKLAIRAALAAVAGLGIATSSWGATATANLSISASVAQKCTISTTPVAFGVYEPLVTNASTGADRSAEGAINLTCTKGSGTPTAVTIGLSLGDYLTGSTRRMSDGGTNYMTYELYHPSDTIPSAVCTFPGTTVWNTGAGLFTPTGTTWGVVAGAQIFKVCGTVPKGQDPANGSYSDVVVATVNF